MDASIDAITNNIQLALASVFLLTAVATLINAISGRLARSVDRMRTYRHALDEGLVKDPVRLDHMNKEAEEAKGTWSPLYGSDLFWCAERRLYFLDSSWVIFLSSRRHSLTPNHLCDLDFCDGINFLYDISLNSPSRGGPMPTVLLAGMFPVALLKLISVYE